MVFDFAKRFETNSPFRRLVRAVACAVAIVLPTISAAQNNTTEEAFVKFLAAGDYGNANFYLQNNLINPELLDTGQVFYDALHEQYWRRLTSNGPQIVALQNYLVQLKPFDINGEFKCYSNNARNKSRCTLLHDLVTGTPAGVIAFFAQLGLDLNKTFPDRPPATYEIIDRLGAPYTISDIQLLNQSGMIFGDETYDTVNLAAFRETNSTVGRRNEGQGGTRPAPKMPHNYLSIQTMNFMDALAIALGNPLQKNYNSQEGARDTALCQYITFVAPQMNPSFDYLRFVLGNRKTFRASQIGVRKRSGNTTYEPFPAPCVALVAGMAQYHGSLNDIIALFGARGDVEMARWLLSLQAPAPSGTAATE